MPTTLGQVEQKRAAAQRAADLVCSGMVVGLDTGSTAIFALRRIGARRADGNLHDIVGLATSTLSREGIAARVVGMPCQELFERQDHAYRDAVLPPAVRARVAVEEAATFGWHRYVGLERSWGWRRSGPSAPIQQVQAKVGFEPAHVVATARAQLAQARTATT